MALPDLVSRVAERLVDLVPDGVSVTPRPTGVLLATRDGPGRVEVELSWAMPTRSPDATDRDITAGLHSLLDNTQDFVVETTTDWWPARVGSADLSNPRVDHAGDHWTAGYADREGWVLVVLDTRHHGLCD